MDVKDLASTYPGMDPLHIRDIQNTGKLPELLVLILFLLGINPAGQHPVPYLVIFGPFNSQSPQDAPLQDDEY